MAQDSAHAKKKGGVWRAIFWIALIVCLCAVLALGFIIWSYLNGQKTYNDIADTSGAKDFAGKTLSEMTVDWDHLRSVNPEVVAWVYIPDTMINYPVCHTTDNEKYLDTDFNGVAGFGWAARYGTIFLDSNNKADFSDANNTLYGHHMNDGSMFAALSGFADQADFDAHRTIYVLTPTMNYQISTFSLVITSGDDLLVQPNFATKEDMAAYIKDKQDRSVVTPAEGMPNPSSLSKIFMLSTCDYTRYDGRAVLYGNTTDSAVPVNAKGGTAGVGTLVNPDDAAVVNDASKEAA